jgi:hypothetical protein
MTPDPLSALRPGEIAIGFGRPGTPKAGLVDLALPEDRSRVGMPWNDALYIALALQANAQHAAVAAGVTEQVYVARLRELMDRVEAAEFGRPSG